MEEAVCDLLRKYWDACNLLQGAQEEGNFPELKTLDALRKKRRATKKYIEDLFHNREQLTVEISEMKLPTLAELKRMFKIPLQGYEEDMKKKKKPEFTITLKETETFHLFELQTKAVDEKSELAEQIKAENEAFKKYVEMKDKIHTDENETQTQFLFSETKETQTDVIEKKDKRPSASVWDMYDSYILADTAINRSKTDEAKDDDSRKDEEEETAVNFAALVEAEKQNTYRMIFERVIASNVYKDNQKIYESKSVGVGELAYNITELWVYDADELEEIGPVTALCWNPSNRMLVAAGYGRCEPEGNPPGAVACWCIKNPENPERIVMTQSAVTSLAFSKTRPYLLAATCMDGALLLISIAFSSARPIVINWHRLGTWKYTLCSVKWYINKAYSKEQEQIVTVGMDGRVCFWNIYEPICNVAYIDVDRSGASPKKLKRVEVKKHHSIGYDIVFHPTEPMTFYVATDSGPIIKCNVGAANGLKTRLLAHEAPVYGIRHSPWCPEVMASFGVSDNIYIWVQGIDYPILKLSIKAFSVEDVDWSPSHASMLACVTHDCLYLWDLQRSALNPVNIVKSLEPLTTVKFSPRGNNILVGSENGSVIVHHLSEMPLEPKLQNEWLITALKKCLKMDPDMKLKISKIFQSETVKKQVKKVVKITEKGNIRSPVLSSYTLTEDEEEKPSNNDTEEKQ